MEEKDISKLIERQIQPLVEKVSKITLELVELRKEFDAFKESSEGNGIYLDGCPEYVTDYLVDNKKDKERGE